MRESTSEAQGPHDKLSERLSRIRGLASRGQEGSTFRLGVAELLALMVPLCAAFALVREISTGSPIRSLGCLVVGAAVCLVSACVMLRRDHAKLRLALLLGLEFALVAGGFYLLFVAYVGWR
jgi:hypothetical protein